MAPNKNQRNQSPNLSAQEHAATFTTRKRTIALIIVALAFVMDLLDGTIVNIAIPSIRTNLSASFSAIQWVIAGYSLAFSILLVTGGRMGDVFGYKKLFILGISGFTIASLLSGIAPNPSMLIIARLLQGAMAALMVPQVFSLMQIMYKPEERSVINGLFGTLGGLAASLGPVIGGVLIKGNVFNLDWRPIFLINIPVGLIAVFAAVKYLPDGKSAHPLKLDIKGTVLIMVAMFLLVFPLIQGREYGWPLWTYIMLAASVPAFGIFWLWQLRKDAHDGSPLVLPSLFKNRAFGAGLGTSLVFYMAIAGFFLTFTLMLQIGLGFSPIHAALTGLPVAIGIAVTMASLGEKVIPKLGRKSLLIGTLLISVGLLTTMWVLHHYTYATHSWQLIPSLLVAGAGMGFMFGSLLAAVLNGVDPKHAGSASGVVNAVQQVGYAVGVALIGVVFFGSLNRAAPTSFNTVEASLSNSLSQQHVPSIAQTAITKEAKDCFVDRTREQDSSVVPQSCKQATSRDVTLTNIVAQSAEKANTVNFDAAFRWAMIFAVCLLAAAFGLVFLLPASFRAVTP